MGIRTRLVNTCKSSRLPFQLLTQWLTSKLTHSPIPTYMDYTHFSYNVELVRKDEAFYTWHK